jgi:hypothetical protein
MEERALFDFEIKELVPDEDGMLQYIVIRMNNRSWRRLHMHTAELEINGCQMLAVQHDVRHDVIRRKQKELEITYRVLSQVPLDEIKDMLFGIYVTNRRLTLYSYYGIEAVMSHAG